MYVTTPVWVSGNTGKAYIGETPDDMVYDILACFGAGANSVVIKMTEEDY